MAGLATIGGGAAAGYLGFNKGVRDAKADQMQDDVDALDRQKMAAASDLLPVQTDLVKRKAASAVKDIDDAEALRPELQSAKAAELKLKVLQDTNALVLTAMKQPEQQAAVTDQLMDRMATHITSGDKSSFLTTLNLATKTPLMQPLNGMGDAVDVAIVPAAEGMVDVMGRAIPKSALQLKMADGTVKLLNADTMTAASARVAAAKQKAGAFVLKPGEIKYDAQGNVIAEGAEKAYGGLVKDEDGNWVDMRPRGAGGTGTGTGKGKAAATPQAQAQGMLDDLFEKNGKDLPPEARARASSFLPAVMQNNPGLEPAVATRVAFEAAMSPQKSLQIDPRSGAVSLTFQNPEIDGGKPFILAPGAGSAADMEKQLGGKKQMVAAVEGMLANQPGQKTGDLIKRAASDDAFRAALEAKIGNPGDVAALRQKIALVKQYGLAAGSSKPVAAPGAGPASKAPSVSERLSKIGGMFSPAADAAPAPAPAPAPVGERVSPVERARLERERNAKQRTDAVAARTSAAEKARAEFSNDAKTLSPEELVRKYDGQRSALSTSDLQVLRDAEQKI